MSTRISAPASRRREIGSRAASISITKAANRSYRLEESRPFWRLRGACLIITLGFTLLIAVLTLAVFNVGGNKYRVVAQLHFDSALILIRHVLTHAEYDKGTWKP